MVLMALGVSQGTGYLRKINEIEFYLKTQVYKKKFIKFLTSI
jgi:hypothetical protein